MNTLKIIFILFSWNAFSQIAYISSNVYKEVPFSDQYISSGALIKSINYRSVNDLKLHLERIYQLKLQDRNEAHITVVTPPEYQGNASMKMPDGLKYVFPNVFDILSYYDGKKGKTGREDLFKLQKLPFRIRCLGRNVEKDKDGKVVNQAFFLVISAPQLFAVRRDLQRRAAYRADQFSRSYQFNYLAYDPHITIGFTKKDIHTQSKGLDSCIENFDLRLQKSLL